MENLQYPIGKFNKNKTYTDLDVKDALEVLANFPTKLEQLVSGLSKEDLEKTYRPEGWNIRQLVHHYADSHSNLYVRLKMALDEDNPTIKGYNEAAWALMSDSDLPIEISIMQVKAIHAKMVHLYQNENYKERSYYHAGYDFTYPLATVACLYAWHSNHHYKHIEIALAS